MNYITTVFVVDTRRAAHHAQTAALSTALPATSHSQPLTLHRIGTPWTRRPASHRAKPADVPAFHPLHRDREQAKCLASRAALHRGLHNHWNDLLRQCPVRLFQRHTLAPGHPSPRSGSMPLATQVQRMGQQAVEEFQFIAFDFKRLVQLLRYTT